MSTHFNSDLLDFSNQNKGEISTPLNSESFQIIEQIPLCAHSPSVSTKLWREMEKWCDHKFCVLFRRGDCLTVVPETWTPTVSSLPQHYVCPFLLFFTLPLLPDWNTSWRYCNLITCKGSFTFFRSRVEWMTSCLGLRLSKTISSENYLPGKISPKRTRNFDDPVCYIYLTLYMSITYIDIYVV